MALLQNALSMNNFTQTASLGGQYAQVLRPATLVGNGSSLTRTMRWSSSNMPYFVEIRAYYGVHAGNGNTAYSVHRFVGHFVSNAFAADGGHGASDNVQQIGTDAANMDWTAVAVGSNNDMSFLYTNNSTQNVYVREQHFTVIAQGTFIWQS